MYINIEDETYPTDPREQAFHNIIREHVIFLLLLIILYGASYGIISKLKRKREEFFADEEDALVYRISSWMCTFSLAVSIGTALLLPFSIVTNEVLILYPDSYYIQWLNDSLIQSLWSYVFVFSNISLFILLPFAYFFTESEGFSGSRKGIMARVYETFVLLLLFSILIFGMTYLLCRLFGYNDFDLGLSNLFKLWNYLPFLYSCVSFFGVLLLLLCTPLGIVNLFTVLGEVITKPHILRNTQEEYDEAILERMSIHRKLQNAKSLLSPTISTKSTSMPSLSQININYHNNSLSSSPSDLHDSLTSPSDLHDSLTSPFAISSSYHHRRDDYSPLLHNNHNSFQSYNHSFGNNFNNTKQIIELEDNLSKLNDSCKELERKLKMGWLRRNLGYPVAMIALMCLTALASFIVVQNTLELLVGLKALPISSTAHQFALGIASLSKIGPVGAAVEISLILYLWCASLVGLYTLPIIGRLRPKVHDTLFTKIIGNCAVILVLSSALPLLSRTVGITNFDLLGDFGRIEWLGSFYVVLFYNTVFAITTALCLTTKIVTAVSRELWKRIKEFSNWVRQQFHHLSANKLFNGTTKISLHAKYD